MRFLYKHVAYAIKWLMLTALTAYITVWVEDAVSNRHMPDNPNTLQAEPLR